MGTGVLRYGMRDETFRISRTESCRGMLMLGGERGIGNHQQATIYRACQVQVSIPFSGSGSISGISESS